MTLRHLLNPFGAPALVVAFLLCGTASAPIADLALPTAGHALADDHDYDRRRDGDGDGIADIFDGCPHLWGSSDNNGCPPAREPDDAPPDVPSDPDGPPASPPCGGGSTVASCTCGRGEEKVYSETRGFYCQGPPHCGTGSGNGDCWCDGGDRKKLGSNGLYYCQDPTADGEPCFYLNPRGNITHSGMYVEGVCVVEPPTCHQLEIAVVATGIATSLASITPAGRAARIALGLTGVSVTVGGYMAVAGCD